MMYKHQKNIQPNCSPKHFGPDSCTHTICLIWLWFFTSTILTSRNCPWKPNAISTQTFLYLTGLCC